MAGKSWIVHNVGSKLSISFMTHEEYGHHRVLRLIIIVSLPLHAKQESPEIGWKRLCLVQTDRFELKVSCTAD